jgi:hypothetical protein
MKAVLRFFPLVLGFVAAASFARGADQPTVAAEAANGASPLHLKFSDPAKPGTVRLKLMWGDVTINAADTQEVTVVSNIKPRHAAEKRPDGLRRLDSEVTYSAAEKDNVITLTFGSDQPGPTPASSSVTLTVPRQTSVIVSNSFGGRITVKDTAGDVEVHNMNGEITLDQISGGALVETMNGEVHATFAKVPADKPLSFSSMNGEIEVRIPGDTKANVRLRTQNGAIYTDFDEKALVTKTEAAPRRRHSFSAVSITTNRRSTGKAGDEEWKGDVHDAVREAVRTGMEAAREAMAAAREAAEAAREGAAEAREADQEGAVDQPIPPIPPMPVVLPSVSGGKVVSGTLNGGGPEIQITTMNGTITLRKMQP